MASVLIPRDGQTAGNRPRRRITLVLTMSTCCIAEGNQIRFSQSRNVVGPVLTDSRHMERLSLGGMVDNSEHALLKSAGLPHIVHRV